MIGFKLKVSEQSYATKNGRYALADHGFVTPEYVFKEAVSETDWSASVGKGADLVLVSPGLFCVFAIIAKRLYVESCHSSNIIKISISYLCVSLF